MMRNRLKEDILENSSKFNSVLSEQLNSQVTFLEEIKNNIINKVEKQFSEVKTQVKMFEQKSLIFKSILEKKFESSLISEISEDSLKLIHLIENLKFYLQDVYSITENVPSDLLNNNVVEELEERGSQDSNKKINIKITPYKSNLKPMVSKKKYIKPWPESKRPPEIPDSIREGVEKRLFTAKRLPKLLKFMRQSFYSGNYNDILFNKIYEKVFSSFTDNHWGSIVSKLTTWGHQNKIEPIQYFSLKHYCKEFIRIKYISSIKINYITEGVGHERKKIKRMREHYNRWVKVKIIPFSNAEFEAKLDNKIRRYFQKYFCKVIGDTYYYFGLLNRNTMIKRLFVREGLAMNLVGYFVVRQYVQYQDVMKRFDDNVTDHNIDEEFIEKSKKDIEDLEHLRQQFARLVMLKYYNRFICKKNESEPNKSNDGQDEIDVYATEEESSDEN